MTTTIPRCQAHGCDGIADDGTGLCAAHRRAVTLTVKVQDAVREFLHDGIKATSSNENEVAEAGTYLAEGVALLLKVLFGSEVSYDREPIILQQRPGLTWRVLFSWMVALSAATWDDEDSDDVDTDELVGAEGMQPC